MLLIYNISLKLKCVPKKEIVAICLFEGIWTINCFLNPSIEMIPFEWASIYDLNSRLKFFSKQTPDYDILLNNMKYLI